MAVRYVTFQGKRVSVAWHLCLTAAEAAGIDIRLNSGRRSMSEQGYLYRNRGRPGFASLVAFPTPWAPHIRVGRADHANDVDTYVGDGEQALQNWLARRLGLRTVNNVPGEAWHLEAVSEAALKAAADRARWFGYSDKERRWITEFDRHKRLGRARARRRRLRELMTEQRKRIWREAQKTGWHKHNRRARYQSLLARTR